MAKVKKTAQDKVEINNESGLLQNQLLELKSQLARTLADYDNLVKRVERDRQTVEKVVSLRLILKLLTVYDGLESAQSHLNDQGLAISLGEFKRVMTEEGLKEINPGVGSDFDENDMEVIEVVAESSDNSGGTAKVSEVAMKGWKFEDGTVVRHAKVKVSKMNN